MHPTRERAIEMRVGVHEAGDHDHPGEVQDLFAVGGSQAAAASHDALPGHAKIRDLDVGWIEGRQGCTPKKHSVPFEF